MSEAILESGWIWENQELLDSQTANQKDSQSAKILLFPGIQDSLTEDTTATDRKIKNNLWTDATPFDSNPLIRDAETPIKLPSVLREKLQGLGIPHDVHQFCIENKISESLDLAHKFVKRCFSGIRAIKLRLVVDPEDHAKWVEINITVPDTDNFLTEYNSYTRLLVAEIPWIERNMLRFNFSFV